ncbi:MAG TPA: M23 family metallopeptidase [Chitinophagaceae bacterium]|nr:M23 family metallopeptidase [Chitinophagaceae bacterium]
MKIIISSTCAILLLLSVNPVFAQPDKTTIAAKSLTCPFEHGSGREPKEAFSWNPPDNKVIMISQVDTIIRSCIKGRVVTVTPAEENHYEIVLNVGDYYFWYYALARPLVSKGQNVTPGQAIAVYTLGSEMEFRMFKFEDMIDPRELLECKVPKAD